ncbi:hypothetical protein PFICI_10109 [Pestalotiopsis fici W106-1]|uniref:Uncharacterized protein n=1 Tax=Pestalotiopsis fici (strain W106-1 / CGMCC3.15140) TaxID=1229662 RepID=W3WY18_PESFW|nr:uncharacterized protein PFICI_10109 [Pestalotiopsis fici W106-1]ETS78047.1 hypothetical protein PFICI_10109 [Pestalotiopsis fici W106-1]
MSSILRSSLRQSSQAVKQFGSVSTNRTYATAGKPPMSQGGSNRNIIIALVGVSLPTLYLWQTRNSHYQTRSIDHPPPAALNSDPAARARAAREALEERGGKVKYEHPEDREPERFKPAFGRQHERKRVDGPPDGRNHHDLHEKQRHL